MSAEEELREAITTPEGRLSLYLDRMHEHEALADLKLILAALEKAQADSARLSSFAGNLILAGTSQVNGEELTGVFIAMSRHELASIKHLPMYRNVKVSYAAIAAAEQKGTT